jgi:DNA-binding LacI/PurR family transcriptional regulator
MTGVGGRRDRPPRTSTLAEVARRAGVSPSTVSYVLNGKRSISEETRRRVQAAIDELGYRPHAGARALASSKSHIVALAIPLRTDLYLPVMMQIAIAVTTAARRRGHDVLLITNDEGPEGIRRVAGTGLADAVILMDVGLDDERVAVLRELDTAAALIGLPADPDGLACVDLDFTAAGTAAADHLAGLGHRQVAFIGSGEGVYRRRTGFAERTLSGFEQRCRELGLRSIHRPCEPTFDSAAGVLARVFDDRPGTTGLVVQNEAAVGPLLGLLRSSGRSVPEDVSVLAIGPDETVAQQSSPQLTSIALPSHELGSRAVELVLGQDPGGPGIALLAPELIVRESTARAPAQAQAPTPTPTG